MSKFVRFCLVIMQIRVTWSTIYHPLVTTGTMTVPEKHESTLSTPLLNKTTNMRKVFVGGRIESNNTVNCSRTHINNHPWLEVKHTNSLEEDESKKEYKDETKKEYKDKSKKKYKDESKNNLKIDNLQRTFSDQFFRTKKIKFKSYIAKFRSKSNVLGFLKSLKFVSRKETNLNIHFKDIYRLFFYAYSFRRNCSVLIDKDLCYYMSDLHELPKSQTKKDFSEKNYQMKSPSANQNLIIDFFAHLYESHQLPNVSKNHLRVIRRVSNGPTTKSKLTSPVNFLREANDDIGNDDDVGITSSNGLILNDSISSDFENLVYGDVISNSSNSSHPYWMNLPIGKIQIRKSSKTSAMLSPVEILHKLFRKNTFQRRRLNEYHKQLLKLLNDQQGDFESSERENISFTFNYLFPSNETSQREQEAARSFLEFISLFNLSSNISDKRDLKNESSGKVAMVTMDTEGIVRIPCYAIIFLLGIVGNSLVILTLVQNRKMRTVTNVFLLNLAISDLLLGVFCMPFTLVGSLLRDFIFGAIMCRMIPYFQATSISVSVWTLVAISLERHYAICHPLQSRGWQTLSHAYKVITLVWIVSFIIMTPIASLSELVPIGSTGRHKCREVWPYLNLERTFSIFLAVTLLLVPLVIMVAAYSSISISLWHGMKLERQTGQGSLHLISMTDLSSLAVVQQSLRSHSSTPKKQTAKISIRFRKYPSPVSNCPSCCIEETTLMTPNHSAIACVSKTVPNAIEAGQISSLAVYSETTDLQCYSLPRQSKDECDCENGNDLAALSSCIHHLPSSSMNNSKLRSTHLEKSIAAKKHVIKMLFAVVLEFFICWTPIFVVNILYLYIPDQVYFSLGSVGISFLHLLSYASSCCNPITYCFMNRKFLQGFKQDLKCCNSRREKKINIDICNLRSLNNKTIDKSNHFKFDREETNM